MDLHQSWEYPDSTTCQTNLHRFPDYAMSFPSTTNARAGLSPRFGVWDYRNPLIVDCGERRFDLSTVQTTKTAYAGKNQDSVDTIWGWELRNISQVLHLGDTIYILPEDDDACQDIALGLNVVSRILSFKGPYAAVSLRRLELDERHFIPIAWIHTRYLHIPEEKRQAAAFGLTQYPEFRLHPERTV